MIRRSFLGLVKPKLKYEVLPDSAPALSEEIRFGGTVTLFVPSPYEDTTKCLLKPGAKVKRGERIAPFADNDAYAVSSVAGTVASLAPYTDAHGRPLTAVTIAAGGDEEEPINGEPTLKQTLHRLENAPGGLSLKAFAQPGRSLDTIAIMGFNDDLLVTSAQQVVREMGEALAKGVGRLKKMTGIDRVILVVPENLSRQAKDAGCEARVLEPYYPNALPKMVMHRQLCKTVPAGMLPEDMGCVFLGAEAVASLGTAFDSGRVPVQKIVTVVSKEGRGQNVRVRVGTPIREVLAALKLAVDDGDRIVMGGPMRGTTVYSDTLPVEPTTDGILLQDRQSLPDISDTSCTNCGECVRICPARLPVNMLVRYLETGHYLEAASRYDLQSCIDCGLCGYVCISHIPIFQYIGLAKHELGRMAMEASYE